MQDPLTGKSTGLGEFGPGAAAGQRKPFPSYAEQRRNRARQSYRNALRHAQGQRGFQRIPWVTWIITLVTSGVWCFTAYQVALAAGVHTWRGIVDNVLANSENADVLITYGAKFNDAIGAGQYWRFVTPIFLHANILHVGLNMLNFFILGLVIERIFGHARFLFIYGLTGVISVIASFYFAPQEVSVGASGAIFGLVGAYGAFVLMHRHAFRRGGIPALVWLVLVIGINLGIGLFVPNVDNYAHVSGLVSGFLLGYFLTPFYVVIAGAPAYYIDTHSLARRWPLALLAIAVTLLMAYSAIHLLGG